MSLSGDSFFLSNLSLGGSGNRIGRGILFARFAVALIVLFSGCGRSYPGTTATLNPVTTSAPNQGAPVTPNEPAGTPPGNFASVGNMTTARADHIAVLLPDGKVLIAGGVSVGYAVQQPLASAELYDPSTHSFTPTGSMTVPRGYPGNSPGAVLLANGKVLLVGGSQDPSAEIYDPSTGTFTAAGNMISGAAGTSQSLPVLLQDGRVLVQGIKAEIYDPTTGTFTLTGAYADANPLWGTSTLLQDGRVLLTGCGGPPFCVSGVTELYDPQTITFSFAGPLTPWDDVNTATLLTNGKVLFVGNADNDGSPADAELYDPSTGTFSSIAKATAPHEYSAAVRLPNGTVLITGGQLPGGSGSAGTDIYDPAAGKFSSAGNMTMGRHEHTATLLPDGTVLIVGGYSTWPNSTSSAEIYKPAP